MNLSSWIVPFTHTRDSQPCIIPHWMSQTMLTLNLPEFYVAESRLILSCSSCIKTHRPKSRSPLSLYTCPALREEISPRARATSFLLPSVGQAGWGQCWLPREPTKAALGAHSHAVLGSEERTASYLCAKSVCSPKNISAKKSCLAGSYFLAFWKPSRKSGNRKFSYKKLPIISATYWEGPCLDCESSS